MRPRFVLLVLCVFVAPLALLMAEAVVVRTTQTNIFNIPTTCAATNNTGGNNTNTGNTGKVCVVGSGLYGPDCEPCACRNESTLVCNDGSLGDGSCLCQANFTGPWCEVPCRCRNNGRCRNETLDLDIDYPFLYRQPCDCNRTSSYGAFCEIPCACNTTRTVRNSSDCDIRGRCKCAGNWGGRDCNRCKPGYWGNNCDRFCNCTAFGSLTIACNQTSGQCFCNKNVTGLKCDRCAVEGMSGVNCDIPCNCTINNALNNTAACDITGQCQCQRGFWGKTCDSPCGCIGYNGTNSNNNNQNPNTTIPFVNTTAICEIRTGQCPCNTGFYGRDCAAICNCNISNVVTQGCDNEGQCRCRQGYWGKTCNNTCNCVATNTTNVALNGTCDGVTGACVCKPGFWGNNCTQPCNCNVNGSLSEDCNVNGQCFCELGVTGQQCDTCATDFQELLAAFCEPPSVCTNVPPPNNSTNSTSIKYTPFGQGRTAPGAQRDVFAFRRGANHQNKDDDGLDYKRIKVDRLN